MTQLHPLGSLGRRVRRTRTPFFTWSGAADDAVPVGEHTIALPIRYWRTDCFMGLFLADVDRVQALLPSGRLHPVRVTGNRAVVAVAAFNYLETGVGPYGEIGVSPLCTLDRASVPVLPLAVGALKGISGFVAHLPVTSRIARQAGRELWGYPKFVADMDFALSPQAQEVTLGEGGAEILRMRINRGGAVLHERAPLITFTAHHGRLIRTEVAMDAYVATAVGGGAGELELGDHPVGRELADLGLSPHPIAGRTYLTHAAILPIGQDLGPTERDHDGYAGADREFGRHTVRYDEGVVRTITEGSAPLRSASRRRG